MTVQTDFETVIATIEASWTSFNATLEGLSDEQLVEPTAVGYWSVVDLAFHIAYWDEVAGKDAEYRHQHGGEKPPSRDWQALNDQDYAKHKGQPAETGFATMAEAHKAMLATFETYKADDLTWAVSEMSEHYDEHAEDIRKWRAAKGI